MREYLPMAKKEWFEEDWFWETFGPIMFDRDLLDGTPDEVQGLLDLTGVGEGAVILDLCCGFGRHSLEMTRRGLNVTGVDLNGSYIKRAKESASKEGLPCTFRQEDVRNLDDRECYDGVVCMWNSFGYTEDSDEDHRILQRVHRALKPEGFVLLDTPGKEVIASGFEANTWFERDHYKILLEYSIEMNWTILKNRWLFFDGKDMKEYQFSQRLYSALELAQLLYKNGFDDIDIWGSWEGDPYDNSAERLIVIGKKLE